MSLNASKAVFRCQGSGGVFIEIINTTLVGHWITVNKNVTGKPAQQANRPLRVFSPISRI
jgi:hypothetical protein